MNAPGKPKTAFSLIELLFVIAIIVILVAILLPAISRARASATSTHCLANLHQIGMYLQEYQNRYDNRLPIYVTANTLGDRFIYQTDFSNLGLLVPAGIAPRSGLESGRVFYCPNAPLQLHRSRQPSGEQSIDRLARLLHPHRPFDAAGVRGLGRQRPQGAVPQHALGHG